MAKKKTETERIKEVLLKQPAIRAPDFDSALSTGSTLLNLAITGHPHAGYLRGDYTFVVGDTNSGKTQLGLGLMAEAAHCPGYDDYSLIFDCVESGVQLNVARYFGRKTADRLRPSCYSHGQPWRSETIEDFYCNLDAALDAGPCVYVLDSMDGLSSADEAKKFDEAKKAKAKHDRGEEAEVKGSYSDGKAKKNSGLLRQMLPKLEKTGSILLIIGQTRDNVGGFSFDPRTRSGGRAPSFYAQVEVWSSVKQKLKRKVRDQDRHIGSVCEFHVRRTRFTGREVKVQVPIYFSAGIDDLGSCVDYLLQEKHWDKGGGGRVVAPELGVTDTREGIVRHVEENGKEEALRSLAAQVWCDVESECAVQRKKRFD